MQWGVRWDTEVPCELQRNDTESLSEMIDRSSLPYDGTAAHATALVCQIVARARPGGASTVYEYNV